MTFLSKHFYRFFFFLFLICNIKTTLWRMFCLGKNNLTTSQVIKRNNEKGKSLQNSNVRAKISNGYWQGFTSVEVSTSQFLNTKSYLQALRLVNDRSDYPIISLCTSCYKWGSKWINEWIPRLSARINQFGGNQWIYSIRNLDWSFLGLTYDKNF